MIQNHKDPNRLLYHYTSMEKASERIIKNGKLRFSTFRKTNDPKESKSWEFNLGTNRPKGLDAETYKGNVLSSRLSDKIKDHARVLCFSRDTEPLSGVHLDDIHLRGFAKPRMWAQYAERHTGVCLVFDQALLKEKLLAVAKNALLAFGGNVVYRNRSVVWGGEGDYVINVDVFEEQGFDRYWISHLETFRQRLFFEKMADWRDENEFRYVVVFDHTDDVFVDYGDALVGVIFGDAADDNAVDALINQLLPTKVEMMALKWKNCSPWYDFGNFKYSRQMRNSPWFKPKAKPTPPPDAGMNRK